MLSNDTDRCSSTFSHITFKYSTKTYKYDKTNKYFNITINFPILTYKIIRKYTSTF